MNDTTPPAEWQALIDELNACVLRKIPFSVKSGPDGTVHARTGKSFPKALRDAGADGGWRLVQLLEHYAARMRIPQAEAVALYEDGRLPLAELAAVWNRAADRGELPEEYATGPAPRATIAPTTRTAKAQALRAHLRAIDPALSGHDVAAFARALTTRRGQGVALPENLRAWLVTHWREFLPPGQTLRARVTGAEESFGIRLSYSFWHALN